MKKITFICIITILLTLLTSCYNSNNYDIPVIKETTIPDSIMKFKFNRFIDDYVTKNPEWNNNELTKKNGDVKFKKYLIKNFNQIVKNNGFTLQSILVSNGKSNHVKLCGQMNHVYITIIGTLDKSVNVTNLIEGNGYIITSGKFIKFIDDANDYEMLGNLTGYDVNVETFDFGRKPDIISSGVFIYSYGTSYWKNIILK